MRFVCFHGIGSNAKVLEQQTERLRQALGRQHDFSFMNGTVLTEPPKGFESDAPSYRFVGEDKAQLQAARNGVLRYIATHGPFDGVLGFSEGGAVAAWLLLHDAQTPSPQFACGIFFCAAAPMDEDSWLAGKMSNVTEAAGNVLINVPTAHIWSQAGDIFPGMGQRLVSMCNVELREDFIHHLGHEIPGSRSEECMPGALRAIERTIERASQ
ncbi:DUF341 domain protein [Thozetella sp. PMI_491]|nr:DUF341 domain protein [Thozetella sp. PMI_491]